MINFLSIIVKKKKLNVLLPFLSKLDNFEVEKINKKIVKIPSSEAYDIRLLFCK